MKKTTFKNHQSNLDNQKMRTGKRQQAHNRKESTEVPIYAHAKDTKTGKTLFEKDAKLPNGAVSRGNPQLEIIGFRQKYVQPS